MTTAINASVLYLHNFLLGRSEPLAVYVESLAAGDYVSAAAILLKFEGLDDGMSLHEVQAELEKLSWAADQHVKQD
jgi:hypothetical protein